MVTAHCEAGVPCDVIFADCRYRIFHHMVGYSEAMTMGDELNYALRGSSQRVHPLIPTEVTEPEPPGTVGLLGPAPDVVHEELLVPGIQFIRVAALNY